jgi:hypothetical protein
LGFADFGFAAFELDFALELAFAFDCDLAFGFDLLDEPARLGADRFLGLVSAISSLLWSVPIGASTQSIGTKSRCVRLNQHEWTLAALFTASKALPGIRFSWLRLSSSQRRSLLPEKNQLEPLSATIRP